MDGPLPTSRNGGARAARYRLPQNIAALPGSIVIRNDRAEDAFQIDRDDDLMRVRDIQGCTLCQFHPRALRKDQAAPILDANGRSLATLIRSELSPVRDQFFVQVRTGIDWTIEGQVPAYEYRVHTREGAIAEVSRRWFRARNSYGVQVGNRTHDALVLAVAICLDISAR